MLKRTERRLRYVFAVILLILVGYSIFIRYYQPDKASPDNKFIQDVTVYKTRDNKNLVFLLKWQDVIKKASAENKNNYKIEHVVPNGRKWVLGPKQCKISLIQHVYGPWNDSEEKRKKIDPEERDKKVTQIFVNVTPREETDDYFKITVKNIETKSGLKLENEEFVVGVVTQYFQFIKI